MEDDHGPDDEDALVPLTIAPAPKHQFFTNSGLIATGYKLFTYEAGTTTKLATYQDADMGGANTNPIVLDSAGRATIFLQATSYKFVLAPPTDSDPPVSPIWTVDEVSAVPLTVPQLDIEITAGEDLNTARAIYLSAGDGGRTAGAWYRTDSDLAYASVTAYAVAMTMNTIATGATGVVRVIGRVEGLSGLTPGLVYYASATPGQLTSTAPALALPIGVADSTTSLVMSQFTLGRAATLVSPGWVSVGTQVIGGIKQITNTGSGSRGNLQFQAGNSAATYSTSIGNLTSDPTNHSNVSTGETDLTSGSIDADTLTSLRAGMMIRIHAEFEHTNNGDANTLKAYFNGVQVGSTHTMNAATADGSSLDLYIWRTGTDTQRFVLWAQNDGGDAADHMRSSGTATGDESTTLSWKFTGTGGASSQITQTGAWVNVW